MEILKKYGLIAVVAIAGILVGRYVIQPKSEIRTKEVIKYVEVFKEKKEEKKNVKTIITEKINKDGSKETKTEIVDTSVTTTKTNKDTKLDSSKETVIKKGNGVTLGLLAIADTGHITNRPEYGATIAVPVFGSLSAQGLVTTDKKIGVGLAISF